MKDTEQIEKFAEIITEKINSSTGQTVSILKKIEKNTAILPKLNLGTFSGSAGKRQTAHVAPGSSFPRTRRALSRMEHPAPVTSTPTATARRALPDETSRQRDSHGRFVGKSKSQEAVAERKDAVERKSILQSLENGFKGASNGTITEAAGRAAGGPLFEAALELKDTVDSFRDGDGFWQKIGKKMRSGAQTGNGDKTVVKTLKDSETKDERRHKELVKAILESNRGGSGGGIDLDFPTKMKGGFSAVLKKVGLTLAASLPFVLPVMGTVAAVLAAVGSVASAGYSAVTGKDNPISKLAQKLKLVPKIHTGKDGKITGGAVAIQSESGKGGAGTISKGKNDAGGKSYGSPQLASAGGLKSQVAQFVQQSSHAEEFFGLIPGTPAFDKKWREVADKNENFEQEQINYVLKTMSAPVLAQAGKGGFRTDDVGVQEFLISQSLQHGPKGNRKILENAQMDLTKRFGSTEAASAQDQIDALTIARKNYVRQVAADKMAKAKRLRAKGDIKGANKAEGEARQLQSIAGTGGRYDRENAMTKELSATAKPKTTSVAKNETVPAKQEPVAETKTEIPQTASSFVASPEDPLSLPSSGPTVTAKPVTDIRRHVLDQIKEKARTMGRNVGLNDAMVDGALSMAGGMIPEPVRSFATSTSPIGNLPERMTTAIDKMPLPDNVKGGMKQVAGGVDTNAVLMAALNKLTATIGKMPGMDEETRPGVPMIKTEFDDTMLTLMAYDRI